MKTLLVVLGLAYCAAMAIAALLPEAQASAHALTATSLHLLTSGLNPCNLVISGVMGGRRLGDLRAKKAVILGAAKGRGANGCTHRKGERISRHQQVTVYQLPGELQ